MGGSTAIPGDPKSFALVVVVGAFFRKATQDLVGRLMVDTHQFAELIKAQ
jgi:hypothetical protein